MTTTEMLQTNLPSDLARNGYHLAFERNEGHPLPQDHTVPVQSNTGLVDCLVETLNNAEIPYCHWKSNFGLTQPSVGEVELDLLVERKALAQTVAILMELEFKQALVAGEPDTPGIYHYYGFDWQTDQFVHVHLFSQILTGESFIKSHLLPFESMLLENVSTLGQMKVASKPAELVVFVLRTFIKYGSLLDLKYLVGNEDEIQEELHWLKAGHNLPDALALLRKNCPVIDESLFLYCVNLLGNGSSLFERFSAAIEVRRSLQVYRRDRGGRRLLAYGQLLWRYGWRRLLGKRKNKGLKAGGATVAFVGPEATGKSTLVSTCGQWLEEVFSVGTVHTGKPPSTLLTIPFNLFLPLVRRISPQLRTTRLEGHRGAADLSQSTARIEGKASLVYALRSVMVAWDRRQLLLRVRRAVANGEIVICDRYPSEEIGAMDSARLTARSSKGISSIIYNRLVRLEQHCYRQIPPPDTVCRLHVSVETAKIRNRDRVKVGKETDAYVESRHRQNRQWHRAGTKIIFDIDTEQPLEQTILALKKAIWEVL